MWVVSQNINETVREWWFKIVNEVVFVKSMEYMLVVENVEFQNSLLSWEISKIIYHEKLLNLKALMSM